MEVTRQLIPMETVTLTMSLKSFINCLLMITSGVNLGNDANSTCNTQVLLNDIFNRFADLGPAYVLRDLTRATLTSDTLTRFIVGGLAGIGSWAMILERLSQIKSPKYQLITSRLRWASLTTGFLTGFLGVLFDLYGLYTTSHNLFQIEQQLQTNSLQRHRLGHFKDEDDEEEEDLNGVKIYESMVDFYGAVLGVVADVIDFMAPQWGQGVALIEYLFNSYSQYSLALYKDEYGS